MNAHLTHHDTGSDGAPPPSRSPAALGLLVLLGVLVGVSVGEVRGFDESVQSRLGERVELVELIGAEQRRVEELSARVEELSAQVEAVEQEALADAGTVRRVEADLEELAVPAGLTAVRGDGLRVELDDAVDGRVEGASVHDVIIHEEDLQAVINALWAGGAEAMSVNGERVLATTAIRCVGNVLLLHGKTYSPPYRIEVIGDPNGMMETLTADPQATAFAEHADRFELGFDVERLEEVLVPAADRPASLRVAAPADT